MDGFCKKTMANQGMKIKKGMNTKNCITAPIDIDVNTAQMKQNLKSPLEIALSKK